MSQYTTGELAKLCRVTVRTVQYYDTRGILAPSALTEGGRRLFSDADLKKLKTICFLRELGFSIDAISKLFSEENPAAVITLLLEQQETALRSEIKKNQENLDRIAALRREIDPSKELSAESIFDIADAMENKKKLRKFRLTTLAAALPLGALQWAAILLWVLKGIWWLAPVWLAAAVPFGVIFTKRYHEKVDYICPECRGQFKPSMREMFFAGHTPNTRKLVCPFCGKKSYCVEVWGDKK